MNLSHKVALVTGSGRGIGQAIALKLAELGASVVVNDIGDEKDLEPVVVQIEAMNQKGRAVIADVTSPDAVNRLVETAVNTYGRLDILVNNAGITRDQLLIRMSDEDWDNVLAVDLKSAFLCTRAALKPMLRQKWGRIINISSITGLIGNAGQANYAAAKAGIIGFTKTVAKEMASRGITANAIAPGFIDTKMTQQISEKLREELARRIPAGYLGTPRDVAEAAAFFASDEARYITGQVLCVDGGMAGA
jgi:3-oxoacyl-[acyl-carrier protein] reductase